MAATHYTACSYAMLALLLASAVPLATHAEQAASLQTQTLQTQLSQAQAIQTQLTQTQPVVQHGPYNVPYALLDASGQWRSAVSLVSGADADLFMADVSVPDWLDQNAERFLDTGQYTVSLLSFYKTRRTCRADQIATGHSDPAHIDACNAIRYRLRRLAVDAHGNTVSLLLSAMIGEDGTIDPTSVEHDARTRAFSDLSADSQEALSKATAIIAKQALAYDRRLKNLP